MVRRWFPSYRRKRHHNGHKNHIPDIEVGTSIKSSKYIVQENSVLISKLNPNVKRVWYHQIQQGKKSICSTEFMQFIPKEKRNRGFLWGLITSSLFQELILKTVTGTTGSRQRAQPKRVFNSKLILPEIKLQKAYSKLSSRLLEIMNINLSKNQILKKLNYILLPKLLTGKINLSKVDFD